jgi:DNA invertase Pin-like site-specific DNA recombinase
VLAESERRRGCMATAKKIEQAAVPEKKQKKVCAYCRVSTESDAQLNSYAAQISYYTKLIESKSEWTFVDIYADEGITGRTFDKRPDFQRMMGDCRNGKIDLILVKAVSRFGRNTMEAVRYIRELRGLNVEVYFEDQNISTSDQSMELYLNSYCAIAQEETVSFSKNMLWSYRKRMENGTFTNCKPIFGYDLDGGTLVINPDEAEVVRRIFSDYLSGKGIRQITGELTEKGVRKKYGVSCWRCEMVNYILTNERYMGDALLRKKCTADAFPFAKCQNKGQKDQYYVTDSHEGIISKEDFGKVQVLLAKKRVCRLAAQRKKYIFTRCIRCAECGSALTRKTSGGKAYWICRNRYLSKNNCPCGWLEENEIVRAYMTMLKKLHENRREILVSALEMLRKMKNSDISVSPEVQEYNHRIRILTGQSQSINAIYAKGYIDSAVFMDETNKINREIAEIRKRKNKICAEDITDDLIREITLLIEIVSKEIPDEINQDEFRVIIEGIAVDSEKNITFHLIGNLSFTEKAEGETIP